MKLGFITSNPGKLKELMVRLGDIGHEVEQLPISYPELQAESIDNVAIFGFKWILENAEKVRENARKLEPFDLIFLEDSGLFVHALNNFPGVYSKFIFTTIGYQGVLELMQDKTSREAHFESLIAVLDLSSNGVINSEVIDQVNFFKGICQGEIAMEPRGEQGFGFDPIFIPKGDIRTFAEMEPQEKNKFSHRGKAMEQLIEFLSGKLGE
jgi:XTP/dITP diphosphohydrolase